VVVRRDHSLFFLRVEWWGPIMVVVGVVVFVAVALSRSGDPERGIPAP
jgi:hypothetical protein